jgi:hypothetical protein
MMDWDDWHEKRKEQKQEEKFLKKQKTLEAKLLKAQLKQLSDEKRQKEKEAYQRNKDKEQWKKSKEEWRGEYVEDRICPRCDKEGKVGKLKIIYTKWCNHYAKAECELCNSFDRWIPHPQPYEEFK